MLQHVDAKYTSAAKRAVRAFAVAFVMIYPAQDLVGWASGSQPLDTSALRAAAVSGMIAAGAYAWRAFIDPLPVNTLSDTKREAP